MQKAKRVRKPVPPLSAAELFAEIKVGHYDVFNPVSIEADVGRELGSLIAPHKEWYEPLLLGTVSHPRLWYDWNIGFIVPQLNLDSIVEILSQNRTALAKSEGIAWGLGEAGSDDSRIVDF